MNAHTQHAQISMLQTDEEIVSTFDVMVQLRPHLKKEAYLAQVRRQEKADFKLIGLQYKGMMMAVAGIRLLECFAKGRHVYVDDLVTQTSERSHGFGKQLLGWITDYARKEGCTHVYLDSGVQRSEAHRFYFREKMHVMAYHFVMKI